MIPYSRQEITEDDIASVISVLKSDFITTGPTVEKFENMISRYTGAKYVTAVNSATSALHIACDALGLSKNDILWTVPNSFVASANCAIYCDAKIDFVDIDDITLNMDIEKLEEKLILAKAKNCLPKIVIPVHFAGEPVDLYRLKDLSNKYGFYIIEDASHAIGAKFQNTRIGNCQFSDACVFSFHPVKIITTGEGGAISTNNKEIARKLQTSRSHGITKNPKEMLSINHGFWSYEQNSLGFNYRLSDIHSALGVSQIKRLDDYVSKRHKIAEIYDLKLNTDFIRKPFRDPNNYSSLHLYVIRVDENKRKKLFNSLREVGIGVNVHYIPIHIQPYYQNLGFRYGDFPTSETYYKQTISLPIYPSLQLNKVDFIIKNVNNFFEKDE